MQIVKQIAQLAFGAALLILALSLPAHAQVRAVVGFSNLNGANQNVQGWQGEVGANVIKYEGVSLGGVASFSGHYEGGQAVHQFLGGPQASYGILKNRVSPFIRGLFGTSYSNGNSFTKSVGFGADVNIGPHVILRPASLDFQWVDNVPFRLTRYSAGIGWQF